MPGASLIAALPDVKTVVRTDADIGVRGRFLALHKGNGSFVLAFRGEARGHPAGTATPMSVMATVK